MSLVLADNRDQAVLALVIQKASEVVSSQNGYLGRTAVQKMMYFLKTLGVPMDYKFEIYRYGPFCETILRDVDYLLADNVIKDKSPSPHKYSNYEPAEAAGELVGLYQQELAPYQELINSVVTTLAPMEPPKLELLSTLDYLYRHEKASGRVSGWKTAVVSKFLEVKGNKFQEPEVARIYDIMANANLVEA